MTIQPKLPLKITPEIIEALKRNQPVVALESTIISHGMPFPTNIETALKVEKLVRENGAVPATIAVLDGQICVGLSVSQIEAIGREKRENVMKLSRRDLPYAITAKKTGTTTVAATMI